MDLQWITDQLEKREIPRARLIETVPGMTHTKLSLILHGRRKLTSNEAHHIRRFFGYRLPDDPPRSELDKLYDNLSELEDHQIRAMALFLEAFVATGSETKEELPKDSPKRGKLKHATPQTYKKPGPINMKPGSHHSTVIGIPACTALLKI